MEVVTVCCAHVSRMTSRFGDFSVAALSEVSQHPSKKPAERPSLWFVHRLIVIAGFHLYYRRNYAYTEGNIL